MPQGNPKPGEKYLHFQNKLYQIIAIAQHADTNEKMVVYQALYGTFQVYAIPYPMFVSEVDRESYPEAKQRFRFQWVEFKKAEPSDSKEKALESGLKAEPPEKETISESSKMKPGPEATAEEKLMAFFDADSIEEKYQILLSMKNEVTDRMINSMAVVMDVVIEEGPLDLRYEELKACLRTMQRYECSRLR